MRMLLRLAALCALVLLVVWFARSSGHDVAGARREARSALTDARKTLSSVDLEALKEELGRTGRVVRRKTEQAARTVAEATEDARTTAAIKAEIAVDPSLSVLDISVDTTDGRVTLAGRVDSAEDVARAIDLAFAHANVREVISTLQVRRK